MYSSPTYLAHHGILGMKWGVRRYQNPDGSLTPEGKKRYEGMLNDHMKNHMKFKAKNGDTIELQRLYPGVIPRTISKINPEFKKEIAKSSNFKVIVNNKKVGDVELYQEGEKSLNGVWLGVDEKYRGKGYATAIMENVLDYAREAGNEKFTLEVPGNSPDARHIYEKQGAIALKKISSDDDVWGGLTAMEVALHPSTAAGKRIYESKFAKHADIYSDYLAHHGIKGMHWGVRRFEGYDGRLTAAGKRRYDDYNYSSGTSKSNRSSRNQNGSQSVGIQKKKMSTAKKVALGLGAAAVLYGAGSIAADKGKVAYQTKLYKQKYGDDLDDMTEKQKKHIFKKIAKDQVDNMQGSRKKKANGHIKTEDEIKSEMSKEKKKVIKNQERMKKVKDSIFGTSKETSITKQDANAEKSSKKTVKALPSKKVSSATESILNANKKAAKNRTTTESKPKVVVTRSKPKPETKSTPKSSIPKTSTKKVKEKKKKKKRISTETKLKIGKAVYDNYKSVKNRDYAQVMANIGNAAIDTTSNMIKEHRNKRK